jgi:predicted DNA binding protein
MEEKIFGDAVQALNESGLLEEAVIFPDGISEVDKQEIFMEAVESIPEEGESSIPMVVVDAYNAIREEEEKREVQAVVEKEVKKEVKRTVNKAKSDQKKYTRVQAFCEVYKSGGRGEALVVEADALYVKNGGVSNLNEAKVVAATGMKFIDGLNIG